MELGQRPHAGGSWIQTVGKLRVRAADRLSPILRASSACKYGRRDRLSSCGTPSPWAPPCSFRNKDTSPVCTCRERGPTWEAHQLLQASPLPPVLLNPIMPGLKAKLVLDVPPPTLGRHLRPKIGPFEAPTPMGRPISRILPVSCGALFSP